MSNGDLRLVQRAIEIGNITIALSCDNSDEKS